MAIPYEFDESPLAISIVADELSKKLRASLESAESEDFGVQEAAILGYIKKKNSGKASEEELVEFLQMIKDAWLNLVMVNGVLSGEIAASWSFEKNCIVFSSTGEQAEE